MMSCWNYMTDIEQKIVGKLLDDILAGGFAISVYDGEEYQVMRSRNLDEIKPEIGATDLTYVYVSDQSGRRLGGIMLINGNDHDIISDYSDNVMINALVAPALALREQLLELNI